MWWGRALVGSAAGCWWLAAGWCAAACGPRDWLRLAALMSNGMCAAAVGRTVGSTTRSSKLMRFGKAVGRTVATSP